MNIEFLHYKKYFLVVSEIMFKVVIYFYQEVSNLRQKDNFQNSE